MDEKLLQPAATITASVLATMAQGKTTAMPKDTIQKTFVLVYQQLQAAEQELLKAAAQH